MGEIPLLSRGNCIIPNQLSALDCIRRSDLTSFSDLFSNDEFSWVNDPLTLENGKTLLILAIEENLVDFIRILVHSAGAKVHLFNESIGCYPLHVAIKVKNLQILQILFEDNNNHADINCRMRNSGRTALHLAAEIQDYELVKFCLSRTNVNVNAQDNKGGQTPLFLASSGSKEILDLLLKYGADVYMECFGSSALENIRKNGHPDFTPLFIKNRDDSLPKLGEIIELAGLGYDYYENLNNFTFQLQSLSLEELIYFNYGGFNLLQKICHEDLTDFAKALLITFPEWNVNNKADESSSCPILIAANKKSFTMMNTLMDHGANVTCINSNNGETVLISILKQEPDFETRKCLEILLDKKEDMKRIVNIKDLLGNTALHYVSRKWSQQDVFSILELGANIGIQNIWKENPLDGISPTTMKRFLDEHCLQGRGEYTHENFELEFDYTFLSPPITLPKESENSDFPETQSLWYLSQSKEHRHLLKHPVISSFLWLKWWRIRKYFNRNLRFFLIFVSLTTWFIFENFGGASLKDENGTIVMCHVIFIVFSILILALILKDWTLDLKDSGVLATLRCSGIEIATLLFLSIIIYGSSAYLQSACIFLLLILIGREFLQMMVSLRRYFLNPENWIEITIIVLLSFLLFATPTPLSQPLASIFIVLSWGEMITLIGRHPKLQLYNVYVTMFYKVLGTFFFFLLWYAFFILAFGLGFYILCHNETEYPFFQSPFLSLVKTSTMFVGELEFSDLPLKGFLSYIFFLSFVFLIVVVLMNLLNGLAVNDTACIQERAEIVGYISRVESISYFESVLLGDPFDFLSNWPSFKWMPHCPSLSFCTLLYKNKFLKKIFHKIFGAHEILLFYSVLPERKLTFKPNGRKDSCLVFKVHTLSPDIVASSKKILLEIQKEKFDFNLEALLKEQMKANNVFQQEITHRMSVIEDKLSELMSK